MAQTADYCHWGTCLVGMHPKASGFLVVGVVGKYRTRDIWAATAEQSRGGRHCTAALYAGGGCPPLSDFAVRDHGKR
jgi:hypothetical protein